MKRILVANLVISSVALVLSGATLIAFANHPDAEPVVYECTCSVEETVECVTEPTEPTEVEATEATEVTEEVSEPTEATEATEETESVGTNYLGEYKLTAYCACAKCCGKSDGITATGTVATQGRTIAVDPRKIPYGTEVIINGHTYVAEDCGGAIKGNRIDIYFDSHSEALQFGVQYADVYIVGS